MSFFFNLDLGLVGILAYALAFLLALTVIVFIHEYGHFQVARWCGVKVETFSVGFGREIRGWTDRYGTRWKIGWIPLGGFVKFEGDANAVSMPDDNVRHDRPSTAISTRRSSGSARLSSQQGR